MVTRAFKNNKKKMPDTAKVTSIRLLSLGGKGRRIAVVVVVSDLNCGKSDDIMYKRNKQEEEG